MKKLIALILALVMPVAALTACGCSHTPAEPTEPSTPTEPAVPTMPTCQHTYEDDGDCTTALYCSVCREEILAAGAHSPEKDDGNCTTEQKCSVCGQTVVAAKAEHIDSDHDYLCDNPGCQVTVGNPPQDENEGIDLPMDRN